MRKVSYSLQPQSTCPTSTRYFSHFQGGLNAHGQTHIIPFDYNHPSVIWPFGCNVAVYESA